MLRLAGLSLRRGRRELIHDANLTVHPGQRVGVTGANGAGKSSLFSLIRNELQADQGTCDVPSGWVIASVAQETPAVERSALEYVLDGDAELRQIQHAIAQAEDGTRLGELYARLEAIEGYSASTRAAKLLHGLGFKPGEELLPVKNFSGGWRMRLNLAQALMCRSDMLLLDEPTNHLDLETVIWLEDWLRSYQGTLLLISHDRDFLDRVVTHVVHIENAAMKLYTGNYSDFEIRRAELLSQQQSLFERQQREIAHIQSFVDRFRAKATKARQAQSRLKSLERMERIGPAHVDSPFHFQFFSPPKRPDLLMHLEHVDAGYGDQPILQKIKMSIHDGDRIGLLGQNGAGKSTLIKILAGELQCLSGERSEAQELRVGYFAQHQLELLDDEASPLLHLQRIDPKATEQSLRDYLGGFAFNGDMVLTECGIFSGGEKARLVLAMIVYRRPNLLLLDEPTNHLDLEMRHALTTALQDFQGAMVIVSHDRHLLRMSADTLMLVDQGRMSVFDGDLSDYYDYVREQRLEQKQEARLTNESVAGKKEQRQQAAEKRKQLQPLRNRLRKLEKELEGLNQKKNDIETELSSTEIYEDVNKDSLKELLRLQAETSDRLTHVEEEWLQLSEELEQS